MTLVLINKLRAFLHVHELDDSQHTVSEYRFEKSASDVAHLKLILLKPKSMVMVGCSKMFLL